MMRISMDKRFKIGTAFNICLLTFIGFFAVYHIYIFDLTVKSNLENDIHQFLTTEKNVRECLSIRQRATELPSGGVGGLNEVSTTVLKFRDDSLQFFNRMSILIDGEGNLIDNLAQQARLLAGPETASAEFNIRRQEFLVNLQKLTTEMLLLRNRHLTILTAKKDGISQTSRMFQNRIALVVVITAIAAFIVLFFLSHQIKLPTRKIIEIIRKVRDGDYAIPVRSQTGNEVDQIIAGLSSMAENLRVRDQLKLDKIQLEKKRFAALTNFINVPLLMVNSEKKVAFANDELLTMFKLNWDEIYEVDFSQTPIPIELRNKLSTLMAEKKWVENEQCDIIGENYAFDLHLSLIPVKSADNTTLSVIIILGRIDARKRGTAIAAKI
ncbi:MAG TPA: hypothetical protein PLM07_10905 [Candidatus Rifleibacterium sp.]|nr:hypothetical protein [Candidatus Rifleibacterium sp.]HPT46401.1 hypothetical protein [Candidatus Rifleibacterium sp.]